MIIQAILLFLCLTAIWFYSYSIIAALEFFSRETSVDGAFTPALSILKPIRGLDGHAYESLASFCRQDYPRFEVIFGVRDRDDPGVEVVEQIMRDFPAIDIKLVVSDRSIGFNAKVSNLANMEAEAAHDLLLISDSDIKVGPDYLKRLVQPMRNSGVGVVTCPYRSTASGFFGRLEALGTSTEFQAGVLVARRMEGMKFGLGATILIRRAAEVGFSLESFAKCLSASS